MSSALEPALLPETVIFSTVMVLAGALLNSVPPGYVAHNYFYL